MTQPPRGTAPYPAVPGSSRRWRAPLLALVCAALAAGCGIRTTSVPVDAGPAPSRVSCAVPDDTRATAAASATATANATATATASGLASAAASATAAPSAAQSVATVYLVCSSQVADVHRSVALAGLTRLGTAVALLRELQQRLGMAEASAGFGTAVQGDLAVEGPRAGDPRGTLRLSAPLSELPPFALAQLVCTYAGNPTLSSDGSVVLGGSDGAQVRRFTCTSDLRTDPGAAETAGTAVK
ncbi:hypothetical protein ACIP98_26410 [Streptomyces sp. NPDC088354]|uniref:hypothetical protein n=1 Tax=Streptomyces sp. NPDC088354 TaxID=3365856 RepID=UPI0037FF9F4E